MSCWTLWQRMPPRYQLTMRDTRCDDQDTVQGGLTSSGSRASSATPRSGRLRTPRGARRADSARARLPESGGAMLTSGVRPEDYPADVQPGPQSPVLPPRTSPYIHNMKNQLRLNTAKRKMDEDGGFGGGASSSPSSTLSYTPKPRATTAPAFPITDPCNTDQYHRATSPAPDRSPSPGTHIHTADPSYSPYERQRPRRGFSGRRPPLRPSSGVSGGVGVGVGDTRRVAVSTISPFGEVKEFRAEGHSPFPPYQRSSPRQQDCVIGEYQVAAVYVDKGRVTFFRKTKPDVTQSVYSAISPYNVTRDDGSYLSHLRKAYLSGVRDLPKVNRKEPDLDKHTTIRERMDYDRKVGRILEYYAKVDIPKDVHAPRPPESQYTIHPALPPPGQQAFKTFASRKRAPGRAAEGRVSDTAFFNNGKEVLSPRDSRVSLALQPRDPAGGFVRINARARLHTRHHFYLRTPMGPGADQDGDHTDASCACGMCRLEMEVALMAQLHRDLGVSVDAIAASQIRSDLENAAADATPPGGQQQSELGPMVEEDGCPARPNSVSDSQRPTVPTAPLQQPLLVSGPSISTQTPPPTAEATSLTVTLPVIEETGEGASAPADVLDTPGDIGERGHTENLQAPPEVKENWSQGRGQCSTVPEGQHAADGCQGEGDARHQSTEATETQQPQPQPITDAETTETPDNAQNKPTSDSAEGGRAQPDPEDKQPQPDVSSTDDTAAACPAQSDSCQPSQGPPEQGGHAGQHDGESHNQASDAASRPEANPDPGASTDTGVQATPVEGTAMDGGREDTHVPVHPAPGTEDGGTENDQRDEDAKQEGMSTDSLQQQSAASEKNQQESDHSER